MPLVPPGSYTHVREIYSRRYQDKMYSCPLVVNLPTCSKPDYAINPTHFETGYARMYTLHAHRARCCTLLESKFVTIVTT